MVIQLHVWAAYPKAPPRSSMGKAAELVHSVFGRSFFGSGRLTCNHYIVAKAILGLLPSFLRGYAMEDESRAQRYLLDRYGTDRKLEKKDVWKRTKNDIVTSISQNFGRNVNQVWLENFICKFLRHCSGNDIFHDVLLKGQPLFMLTEWGILRIHNGDGHYDLESDYLVPAFGYGNGTMSMDMIVSTFSIERTIPDSIDKMVRLQIPLSLLRPAQPTRLERTLATVELDKETLDQQFGRLRGRYL